MGLFLLVGCGASSPATRCPFRARQARSAPAREEPPDLELEAGMVCIANDVMECALRRYNGFDLAFAIDGMSGAAKLEGLTPTPSIYKARTPAEQHIKDRAVSRPVDPKTRSCVERAVARLLFAPFRRGTYRLSYRIRVLVVTDYH